MLNDQLLFGQDRHHTSFVMNGNFLTNPCLNSISYTYRSNVLFILGKAGYSQCRL